MFRENDSVVLLEPNFDIAVDKVTVCAKERGKSFSIEFLGLCVYYSHPNKSTDYEYRFKVVYSG